MLFAAKKCKSAFGSRHCRVEKFSAKVFALVRQNEQDMVEFTPLALVDGECVGQLIFGQQELCDASLAKLGNVAV